MFRTYLVIILTILTSSVFSQSALVIDDGYVNLHKINNVVLVCGNFYGTTSTPAIHITYTPGNTGNPTIIIHNSYIEGPGYLIDAFNKNSTNQTSLQKVVIKNCQFKGTNPAINSSARNKAAYIAHPILFEFYNNYLENTCGVGVIGNESSTIIRITKNQFKNIDGRISNGGSCESCYLTDKEENCSAISLGWVVNAATVDISWNEIINQPDHSAVEDNVNIYLSGGSSSNYINIHNNYLFGAYKYPSTANRIASGGGFNISDGCAGLLSSTTNTNSYIKAEYNQVINTISFGIAIHSGRNNIIRDNRIVSSGKIPGSNDYADFQKFNCNNASPTSAINVSPWYYMTFYNCRCPDPNGADPYASGECNDNGVKPPTTGSTTCYLRNYSDTTKKNYKNYLASNFYGHIISNNYIRWSTHSDCERIFSSCNTCNENEKYISTTGLRCLDDSKFNYQCGLDGNQCGDASVLDEESEYLIWKQKLKNQGINIGLIPNGNSVLITQLPLGQIQNQSFTAYYEVRALQGTELLTGTVMEIQNNTFTVCLTNNNPTVARIAMEGSQEEYIPKTNDLIIFPNPSNGKIFINLINRDLITKIVVTNSHGVDILNQTDLLKGINEISLYNQSEGLYLIKVETMKEIYNAKFMIQH